MPDKETKMSCYFPIRKGPKLSVIISTSVNQTFRDQGVTYWTFEEEVDHGQLPHPRPSASVVQRAVSTQVAPETRRSTSKALAAQLVPRGLHPVPHRHQRLRRFQRRLVRLHRHSIWPVIANSRCRTTPPPVCGRRSLPMCINM